MLHKPRKIAWISSLSFIGFVIIVATIVEAQRVSTMPAYPVENFSTDTAHKVLRVIDGDTVELNYNGNPTIFRLIGVDTPEIVSLNRSIEPFGKEASEFTRNLLLGESVYLRFDAEQEDMYGRRLAYLYRAPDGLFVNLEIVRQGYGRTYTRYPFKHMDLFRSYGSIANIAQKGLFGYHAPVQSEPFPTDDIKSRPSMGDMKSNVQVYVTRTGKKYHRGACEWLSKSKIPISLAEAKQEYSPCWQCNPPQ